MELQQKKYGYNLIFCEQRKDQTYHWKDITNFAAADTAEEAVENLLKLMRGSTELKDMFKTNATVLLTKFELIGSGKKLLSFETRRMGTVVDNLANILISGSMVGDPWKNIVFDYVDRELLSALVKTFPDQKQFFKGKVLEGSLGL
jgi:hypothetical protein